MFTEFASLLEEASADNNTVVTAVTGAGNFFTAGNDLSNLKLSSPESVSAFIKNVEM